MSHYLIKCYIAYISYLLFISMNPPSRKLSVEQKNQYCAALPCRIHQGLSVGGFMRKWFSSQGVRKKQRKNSRKSDHMWVMTTPYLASTQLKCVVGFLQFVPCVQGCTRRVSSKRRVLSCHACFSWNVRVFSENFFKIHIKHD